jgi:hypothetical protein
MNEATTTLTRAAPAPATASAGTGSSATRPLPVIAQLARCAGNVCATPTPRAGVRWRGSSAEPSMPGTRASACAMRSIRQEAERCTAGQPAHRHGGAGLRQHPASQAHEPLHAAWQDQGGHAMAALLPGAQHRKDRHAGDANGLKGKAAVLWAPCHARALTRCAPSGFNSDKPTRRTQTMNRHRIRPDSDTVLRFEKRVIAQSR